MAKKVRFVKGFDQKTMHDVVERRLRAHYETSDGSKIGLRVNEEVRKSLIDKVNVAVLPATEAIVQVGFNSSLDQVRDILLTGIQGDSSGPPGDIPGTNIDISKWQPHRRRYKKRKLRRNSSTAFTYWRRKWKDTGKPLGESFRAFAGSYKSKVTKTKSKVTLHKVGNKLVFRGKFYQISINYTLPEPKGGHQYMDSILRRPFMNFPGGITQISSDLFSSSDPLARLAFNEDGRGNRHRPFIRELMSSRGREVREELQDFFSRLS